MTAIKAADVDRFIARPDPAQPIVLVYGPDAGLVRERVDALVRASVDDPNDPFAFVRIEGEELSGQSVAAGGRSQHHPAVRRPPRRAGARPARRNIRAGARAGARHAPSPDCRVIIEAGDLRKTAPLRALCEKAKAAAALPCYLDNGAARSARLIDEEMRAAESDAWRPTRARRSHRVARRRPARLAQRTAQARALRHGPRARRTRRRARGGGGCLRAGARRRARCRLCRQDHATSKPNSARRAPAARRRRRSSRPRSARSPTCTR